MQNVDPFLFRDEIWSSDTEDLEMLGFFKIETIRKKIWNTARVLAKQKTVYWDVVQWENTNKY
jgi:hypothetical protein